MSDEDDIEETGILSPEHAARYDFWEKEVTKIVATGEYPNQILEQTRPHKAIAVLMMLEEGRPMREICEKFNTNFNAIIGMRARHSVSMKERRSVFSKLYSVAAESLAYLLIKKTDMLANDDAMLAETSLKDIALGMGIATDKAAMLDGMATQTIEVRRGASVSDAAQFIAAAKARAAEKAKIIEAEIIPSTT